MLAEFGRLPLVHLLLLRSWYGGRLIFLTLLFRKWWSRGERDRLLQRFKNLVVLSCSLAAIGAVMFAVCNKPFVEVWTHGKVTWDSRYDVLLGIWLIVLTLVHCHCGFVVYLKRIGFMKYIYFIEGSGLPYRRQLCCISLWDDRTAGDLDFSEFVL